MSQQTLIGALRLMAEVARGHEPFDFAGCVVTSTKAADRIEILEAALHEIIAWWESEDEDIKVMEIATRALRGKS